MLVEVHHWTLKEVYETDIDDLMVFLAYYPEWKRRIGGGDEPTTRPLPGKRQPVLLPANRVRL